MPTVPFTPLTVYVGDTAGGAPSRADVAEYLVPLRTVRTAGGGSLDHAVFAYNLGALGERIVNVAVPLGWSRQIEVRAQPEDGPELPVFWGELTVQEIAIDTGEEAVLTARVEPYHFGDPLHGYLVRDPLAGNAATLIWDDPTFNPLIDGIVEANRSDATHNGWRLWLDPESMRTVTARGYQSQVASLWDLETAVDTLIQLLNFFEEFIANPSAGEAPDWSAAASPDNLRLPRTQYLPFYLDALLRPHGYNWYLKPELSATDAVQPRIVIFRVGEGTEKELRLQRPGASLDVELTNAEENRIETNVADLANRIEGTGSLQEREITVQLHRGWAEAEDAKTPDELDRADPESDFESAPNAWRLWVANEAGDYNALRTTLFPVPGDAHDLSGLFATAVPRRRKFGRCLTKDANGQRRPPFVEWWDPEGGAAGTGAWEEVPSGWGAQIIKNQLGVYFAGDMPPEEMVDAGDDAKLRVTGTVAGDERLNAAVDRRESSPNLRRVVLTLDLSDRFHDRQVQTGGAWSGLDGSGVHGAHTSVLAGDANGADEHVDWAALEDYLEQIQDAAESAAMRARFVVFGLTWEYEIGDLITKIAGREISLNRNSPAAASPKYLQITGIVWDYQRQRTELIVEAAESQPANARKSGRPRR